MDVINQKEARMQFPVAIVVSRFNERITGALLEGALQRLEERDFKPSHIQVVWVPGAVEIPLVAKKLVQKKKHEAVICLGAVIRGETSHYDYVCDQVSQGVKEVMLESGVPVIFGVLTTDNAKQAEDRIGGNHGHKGKESVDAAVEMVAVMRQLNSL